MKHILRKEPRMPTSEEFEGEDKALEQKYPRLLEKEQEIDKRIMEVLNELQVSRRLVSLSETCSRRRRRRREHRPVFERGRNGAAGQAVSALVDSNSKYASFPREEHRPEGEMGIQRSHADADSSRCNCEVAGITEAREPGQVRKNGSAGWDGRHVRGGCFT